MRGRHVGDVEKSGRAKVAWLETFLTRPNGVPSHDTFDRVFALLDPAAFGACFGARLTAACARVREGGPTTGWR